jgi:hypothetical protein
MKRLTIPAMVIALVTTTMVLSNCDSEDSATYDATVAWTINKFQVCTFTLPPKLGGSLDFDTIEITVYKNEKDIENGKDPVMEGLETDCSKLDYTIKNIDRGNYFVVLKAMATYDGMTLPYFIGSSELVVPSEEPTEVELTMNSASLTVGWDFDRGFCDGNGVEEIQATLEGESKTKTSGKIPCTDETYTFEDLTWGDYSLEVEGFNAKGEVTHRGSYIAEASEDTGEADAGGDDAGTDDPNLLDIRPGTGDDPKDITYVILQEV